MDINNLFDLAIEKQASDLHLVVGYHPSLRINNLLFPLRDFEKLTAEESNKMILGILNEEQKENLLTNKEIDFGYEHKDFRFRANVYHSKGKLSAAFRLINNVIKNIADLSLPPQISDFANYNQGLILITGPTGEGKSTTLASIVNEINKKQQKHIITIEDPIEYIYKEGKAIVSQRELHQDTHSWQIALRSVLREDPDVVLVGEMRDYETIQSVLTIAETGHLILSSLHTGSAPEAINRIIDVFPAHQQNQIRAQLAAVLNVIITQRLVPTIDNIHRIPAIELLFNIPSVASTIREGKVYMLDNILETEQSQGLILFEKYLASLYMKGLISKETALSFAIRPNEIQKFIK